MEIQAQAIVKSVSNALELELKNDIVTQRSRYARIQPLTVMVPCSGSSKGDSATGRILIQQDGDFSMRQLGISIRGPVDVNGKAIRTAPSTNARQTAFPSGLRNLANWDISSSGVLVQITEAGSGLKITEGYVDISTIASPGYLAQNLCPLNLRYVLRKNVTLQFDFRNRDDARLDTTDSTSASDLFHQVSIGLIGQKYNGVAANI